MQRIHSSARASLFDVAQTRRHEAFWAARLPPNTLMQRAGLAVAQMSLAVAPHARRIWIACGPGNNGGDGLEAAMHLQQWGKQPIVTWAGRPDTAPADALASWARARDAGVCFATAPPSDLTAQDLCLDAMLGIGAHSAPSGQMQAWLRALNQSAAPTLAVDIPSGLLADTGQWASAASAAPAETGSTMALAEALHARYTLTLLTCKPGLFTAQGRDAAGEVWFDDLGVPPLDETPAALVCPPGPRPNRLHNSHKGSYGDVAIVGGESLGSRGMGMTGAAVLAATAALHSGAGRVLLSPLGDAPAGLEATLPELMLRQFQALSLEQLTVVCGCGGGLAVEQVLEAVVRRSQRLVLDADALNALARHPHGLELVRERQTQRQPTVVTPHPLEAARLLQTSVQNIQKDRLRAARELAASLNCTVVLKGSGTIVASPQATPQINLSGNARLATAGTGDVLAGCVGALMAAGLNAHDAAATAVFHHGETAQRWASNTTLTAASLARHIQA